MEKYNFVGKNIDKHTEGASRYLDNRKDGFMDTRHFPKEVEKTQNDIEDINKISGAINSELRELDLPPDFAVDPKQIHFSNTKEMPPTGTYSPDNQQIEINTSKSVLKLVGNAVYQSIVTLSNINVHKKLSQFEVLLHESVHASSFHQYLIKETSDITLVDPSRMGYRFKTKDKIDYFKGLNEAVVQKTTQDIIFKLYKSNKIQKDIHKIFFSLAHSYVPEVIVLEKIISKISKEKKEDEKDVWKRFEKGQFTGEMMHLRDVEKVYGPGSLRILASMNPSKTNPLQKVLYYTYFSTNKKSLKESVARILLRKDKITEEKYDQHINKMEDK